MNNNNKDFIRIGFMNVRGQTGLDESKQFQIEQFIQIYKIDILNCQEINIEENSFRYCKFITANFEVITNNASNKYGTCTFIKNNFSFSNVKMDTNGRALVYDINNITFGNVYLPSGNDAIAKQKSCF